MGVKMWSPKGEDCHLSLTSGHTLIVPADEKGRDVPEQFVKEAVSRGCLPVGMKPTEESAGDTFNRDAVIQARMRDMLNSDDTAYFTGDHKPNLGVLSRLAGFTVDRAERDKLWEAVEKDPDALSE